MGAQYTYLFADLMSGAILDELPLFDVSFDKVLGDAGSLRGRIPVADPVVRARDPRRLTEPARTAVYVDRDGVLVWGGIVWTSRYNPSDQMLEISAADFLSYLGHRTVQSVPPGSPVDFIGSHLAIARRLLELTAEHPGGDIDLVVRTAPAEPGPVRHAVYEPDDLKPVDEALFDLADSEDGFELAADVAYGADGRPERRLLLGRPRLGQPGAPHVWEYGANLIDYTWPQDGSAMATRVFVSGTEDTSASAEDTGSYPAGWPLLEAAVSHTDIDDVSLLETIARAELAARRRPVVLPELTVRADLSPDLGTYAVGDDARIVIDDRFLSPRGAFDIDVRIVGFTVTPGDDGGREEVGLTVAPAEDRTGRES